MKQKNSDHCQARTHDLGRRHPSTPAGDCGQFQQAQLDDPIATGMGSIDEAGSQAKIRGGGGGGLRFTLSVDKDLVAA
ncbi:hypothetical protein AB4Z46_34680 [Variovorax sp. M-6]|uniref:hypothetical protein n=1 Tax=Variovorax sp. M-6 TaxID=3233041 RepID=UPI003F947C88